MELKSLLVSMLSEPALSGWGCGGALMELD